jgi:serine/threonine protein phosphatase PrpC
MPISSSLLAPSASSIAATENTEFQGDYGNSLIISISEEMNPKYRCTMEDCCVYHPPSFFRIDGRNPPVHVRAETTTSPQKKRPRSELSSGVGHHLGNNEDRWHMMGVYDGHGGRDIADYLEHNLGHILREELHSDDSQDGSDVVAPVLERIERSMLLADVDSYRRGIHASGATVVLCLLRQEPQTIQPRKSKNGGTATKSRRLRRCTIYTANCGDARAVLYDQNGRVCRLSFDHKADDKKEKQRVENAGGFVLKGRVLGVLAVARSMGDHLLKEFVTSRPHLQETVIEYDLLRDFTTDDGKAVIPPFLIIACDGLWDVVGDEEAARIVRRYIRRHVEDGLTARTSKESDSAESDEGRNLSLEDAAKALTSEALKRGSTDNVSVIVTVLR